MNGMIYKGEPVVLNDGQEHFLLYDLNAFCELEEHYGDVYEAMNVLKDMKKIKLRDVRFILWAGLAHEGLSQKEVGHLIHSKNMKDIMRKITRAFSMSLPEVKDTKKK